MELSKNVKKIEMLINLFEVSSHFNIIRRMKEKFLIYEYESDEDQNISYLGNVEILHERFF